MLVRRARDAGITFHWSTSKTEQHGRGSATEKKDSKRTSVMYHPNHFGVYYMLYTYAAFALLQAGVVLWQLKGAFNDACPDGVWAHRPGSSDYDCFGPTYVWLWTGAQVALSIIILPAAVLAGKLIYRDNFVPQIVTRRSAVKVSS